MAEYAHVDGTGRVVNVILIEPEVAANYPHLLPLEEGHSVGEGWHTEDGGATWTDQRDQHGPITVAIPFTLAIEGSVDDLMGGSS